VSPALIARIRELGYRVFMRLPSDSWLYYTDAEGKNIGQLSAERFGGYWITTVHIPNRTTGTGFRVKECSDVDAAALELGFATFPGWPLGPDAAATVKKWDSWEHFQRRDSWNASYREVLP